NGPQEVSAAGRPDTNITVARNDAAPANQAETETQAREARRKLREELERGNNSAPVIAAVPTPTTPGAPQGGIEPKPSFRTYTVAKNDTLEKIAKRELGSSQKWRDIVKVNEGLDPKRLKAGASILLPN
ncbi:MAG TPA: LysM peptidoglycan-binding domain-containing protein, partial [Planctomycetota bacterium]|nr:LysM peptidoglycan-binding domain-containing protein [Planctomycetota bacterium]